MATHSVPKIDQRETNREDSRERLLDDVMEEINRGLDRMTKSDRARAAKEISTIAENVRKRREK